MTSSGSAESTLNLISNASIETFPGNKLPTPITLSGDWQVAFVEISWPVMLRNITEHQITVSKIAPCPKSPPPHQSPSKNIPSRRPGVVSMSAAPVWRSETSIEVHCSRRTLYIARLLFIHWWYHGGISQKWYTKRPWKTSPVNNSSPYRCNMAINKYFVECW